MGNFTWIQGVLLAILSTGGALAINAIFKGVDSYRNGTARTEARGIRNLGRWRDEADQRALEAEHRRDYALVLVDYWRAAHADQEHKVRTEWGPEHVLQRPPIPVMGPIPQLEKKANDDG